MEDVVISVNAVSKRYRLYEKPAERLLHAIRPRRKVGVKEIVALNNVSFEVRKGEAVAIIGRNGSGKSTLLQILTGTLEPSSGSAIVRGRVSALLELGSGFNPEYTGRDNVLLNGLLLGFSRNQIIEKMPEIEAFAEIGEAIDQPTKTYSSGMVVRLAFAVQVLLDPEILIVDEALSVGDFFFQQKCLSYIRALRERGVTLLFVSHDMATVRDLCDKGLVLKNGLVTFWGDNLEAVNSYLGATTRASVSNDGPGEASKLAATLELPLWSSDTLEEGKLLAVGLYDKDGRPVSALSIGDVAEFVIAYRDADCPIHATLTLRNRYDQVVTTFSTFTSDVDVGLGSNNVRKLAIVTNLLLEAGEYSFNVNLGASLGASHGESLDATPWLGPFSVKWDYQSNTPPFFGMVGLPSKILFVD